jgi:hypothetical protein
MGGIINNLFGGGSSKQMDKALDFAKDVYKENKAMATPWVTGGGDAFNSYNSFLTGAGQEDAFQKYLQSGDYEFTTKQGMEAINQNMAAKGLLNSGSTLKALTQWGQDNAMKYRENYMDRLLQSAGIGAGVMGNLMGASNNSSEQIGQLRAQKAEGKASGVGNFLNFGLGVAGLIPSDERLKKDKERIGSIKVDGKTIGLHAYRYKGEPSTAVKRIGVMAQEIAKKVPRALGPKVGNFMSVDYKELLNA